MSEDQANRRMLDWGIQPPHLYAPYVSSLRRAPDHPLVPLRASLSERTGPVYGEGDVHSLDHDLTKNAAKNGEPLGERIMVAGRVLDESGRPVPHILIEVWQANAAGRYIHKNDQHDAPLDPNFVGAGRVITNAKGEYRFISIKPGAYPWRNHSNAWRPAHIHFSLIGRNFTERLVTQMYFPGDPLLQYDPIYQGIPNIKAREQLISSFDLELTQPEWALGYCFDIVLAGRDQTYFEEGH